MNEPLSTEKKTINKAAKERQFKGMSLSERKLARREKLIEAGIFFCHRQRYL